MAQSNCVRHLCQVGVFPHVRHSVRVDQSIPRSTRRACFVQFSRYQSTSNLDSTLNLNANSKQKLNALPDLIRSKAEVGYVAPIPDRTPADILPDSIPEDPDQLTAEQALLIKRDVSRMPRPYRDKMGHVDRPPEILFDAFKRRGFQRQLYGTYGEKKSGVSPSLAWPTVEEIREKVKREKEMGKPNLHESWEHLRVQREAEQKKLTERERKIIANMKQMKQHLSEFRQRRKLIEDAAAAEQRKRQLLLEEARDTLGFDVDPRDPRFLELMEQRESELKRKRRLQKRQEKEDSIIHRLKDMVEEDTTKSARAEVDDDK